MTQQPHHPGPGPQPQSGKSTPVKLLIGCAIAVFVAIPAVGICAALAIPAFVQYLNQSKAAEADSITQMVANSVVAEYSRSCEFPPSLPATADPADCCGGEQCVQDSETLAIWREAGIPLEMTTGYFAYQAERINDSTFVISAEADFRCGPPNHRVVVEVEAVGECEAVASEPRREYEFQ